MKKVLKVFGSVTALMLVMAAPALAEGGDVGVNIGDWLTRNVIALFPPILAGIAIYHMVKREFARFISFLCFAILVGVCVYLPDTLIQLARKLGPLFFK